MNIEYATVTQFRKVINPAQRPAEGYGEKIPTDWQVIIAGEKKWRKVYAICWSNVASHYIMLDGKREFIRDSDFPEPTDPSAQYVKA